MRHPRSLAVALAALAIALVLASCGGGSSSKPSAAGTPGRSGRLFVQTANAGQLSQNGDGTMALHLVGADSTIWFTDRPARMTGSEDTAALVQAWGVGPHSFAKEPPNAVMQAQQNGARHDLPAELTNPRFAAGGTLDYTLRVLPQGPGSDKTKGAVPPLAPGALGSATVFIDDATQPSCWVLWSMTNINSGINAGLTGINGGSITYTFDGEVEQLSGNLFGFIPSTGAFGTAGPDAWRASGQQAVFVGNGMLGGQLYFFTWVQAAAGSEHVTGSFVGAGAQPTAQSMGCTVNITSGNQGPFFAVNFSS
jgi:hypothetical protein